MSRLEGMLEVTQWKYCAQERWQECLTARSRQTGRDPDLPSPGHHSLQHSTQIPKRQAKDSHGSPSPYTAEEIRSLSLLQVDLTQLSSGHPCWGPRKNVRIPACEGPKSPPPWGLGELGRQWTVTPILWLVEEEVQQLFQVYKKAKAKSGTSDLLDLLSLENNWKQLKE